MVNFILVKLISAEFASFFILILLLLGCVTLVKAFNCPVPHISHWPMGNHSTWSQSYCEDKHQIPRVMYLAKREESRNIRFVVVIGITALKLWWNLESYSIFRGTIVSLFSLLWRDSNFSESMEGILSVFLIEFLKGHCFVFKYVIIIWSTGYLWKLKNEILNMYCLFDYTGFTRIPLMNPLNLKIQFM